MSMLYCFLYALDYFCNFILWLPMRKEIEIYKKVLAFNKSSKHLLVYFQFAYQYIYSKWCWFSYGYYGYYKTSRWSTSKLSRCRRWCNVQTSHRGFQAHYFRSKGLLCYDKCYDMSRVMRKPDFFLWENEGADQLRSYCEADRCLCFRYTDSTIPPLLISKISRF